jgi:hypothetical protein
MLDTLKNDQGALRLSLYRFNSTGQIDKNEIILLDNEFFTPVIGEQSIILVGANQIGRIDLERVEEGI